MSTESIDTITDAPHAASVTDSAPAEPSVASRDTTPTESNGRDKPPTTLQGMREELKKKRELSEARATRKGELDAMSDDERKSEFRKTAIEANEPPPTEGDRDLEHLHTQIEALPLEQRSAAYDKLHRAYEKKHETHLAEIAARERNVRMQHEASLATYQAQSNHIAITDQMMQANFEQAYGVPMSAEGLQHLAATNPDLVAAAALDLVTLNHQRQQAQDQIAQYQYASAADEQQIAAVNDWQFTEQLRKSDPDLLDGNRIKPEVQRAAGEYLIEKFGLDTRAIRSMWESNQSVPMRSWQMQQMLLDASRYRAAKLKAATAKKAPMPEVQRPGERGPGIRGNDAEFERLDSMRSLNLKQAAKLNKLRRERNA